jgi:hypothetical protein
MLFLSLLAFLPNLILGFSFAHLLWNDARISSIFLKGFLGIPLGMGISSILLFFWKLAGLSHSGYIVFELVFVTLVFVAMLLDQKKIIGGVKFDIGTNYACRSVFPWRISCLQFSSTLTAVKMPGVIGI